MFPIAYSPRLNFCILVPSYNPLIGSCGNEIAGLFEARMPGWLSERDTRNRGANHSKSRKKDASYRHSGYEVTTRVHRAGHGPFEVRGPAARVP